MELRSLREIVACDECGNLVHRSLSQQVSEVIPGQHRFLHYCAKDRKGYDYTTTTSGYRRFYLNNKEIK